MTKTTSNETVINVSSAIGKLMDYTGKLARNDTGKPVIEPFRRVSLPEGKYLGNPTGYGLVVTTKTGKIMYFTQFNVDVHGVVLIACNEADFNSYTNSRSIQFNITCGEPNKGSDGNVYTNILKIEKAA